MRAFEGSHGLTIFIILAVLEFALVAGLVGLVRHMGLFEAGAVFIAYCVLNGVTFSVIFLVYTTTSIVSAFLVTAAMFGGLALWGYTTKADLTGWAASFSWRCSVSWSA
jgi:FtsH-binding integral membrane protein